MRNNMKTYLLLLLAFAMKMTSWAQDNMLPTVVDGRIWNVVSIHPAEPPESDSIPPGYYQDIKGRWGIGFPHTYMLRGDTIMNDVAYKKLYLDDRFVSGLREEDGRVYERYWEDVPEQLIFDFYLQPGEIFKDEVDDMFQMEVKQVREVDVDGKSRKCMDMWAHMEGMEIVDGLVDYWIEGIGCMNGPHFPFWWEAIDSPSLLLSCYDGDECIFTIEDLKQFTSNPSSCPDDNHPHAIDLGLPSGTKWACCNVGADKPEAYGGYYAWGETEEKSEYSWDTYIYCDGTCETCHNLGNDIAGTQYDVAHINWGDSWVMPSEDQIKELSEKCAHERISVNGIYGGKFTSNINGNSIFLPAAGRYSFDESVEGLMYVGNFGYYWTSIQSPSHTYDSCSLTFGPGSTSDCTIWIDGDGRFIGRSVRPVISTTTNINHPESFSNASDQAIYNIYGIKVASYPKEIDSLPPGVYITNGKKIVIK